MVSFIRGHLGPFAPEVKPDADEIAWRVILPAIGGNNRLDLEKTFGRIDYCCAYLRTIVYSPTEQTAHIELAVDDYIRAWLNGKPASGEITLRQGTNVLMLKVGDHGGGWNFMCRLTQPNGEPLEGLKFQLP